MNGVWGEAHLNGESCVRPFVDRGWGDAEHSVCLVDAPGTADHVGRVRLGVRPGGRVVPAGRLHHRRHRDAAVPDHRRRRRHGPAGRSRGPADLRRQASDRRHRRGGHRATGTALVGCVLFLVDFFVQPQPVPHSVPLLAVPIAVLLAVGSRLAFRLYREHRDRADHSDARRVIIYGAGVEGQQLLRSMLSDPAGPYLPVALLDDDRLLRRYRLSGVAVHGTRTDVARRGRRDTADLLVIADRSLPDAAVDEIASAASAAGPRGRNVPALYEMLKPLPGGSRCRSPRPEDGRRRRYVAPAPRPSRQAAREGRRRGEQDEARLRRRAALSRRGPRSRCCC